MGLTRQFEKPCIVFDDLEEMRDSMDYGTRMNRRLHHLAFRGLQCERSYKASFEGLPTGGGDPYKTSQRSPLCGPTDRANRNKKRFECRSCSHQERSDRGAIVNVAVRAIEKHQNWNVSALDILPKVREGWTAGMGVLDTRTVTHDTSRGSQTDGIVGPADYFTGSLWA